MTVIVDPKTGKPFADADPKPKRPQRRKSTWLAKASTPAELAKQPPRHPTHAESVNDVFWNRGADARQDPREDRRREIEEARIAAKIRAKIPYLTAIATRSRP
ncbi:hypothetical protein [uncultured Thiocystis sp.]|jgi:hypothetical protein|uniref:hypothetical protein n=1 Tax=uncultured Thiocystis sp. TaxID=1202134 RepID=UPI0025CD6D5E|nr:hypothetical protein [uncultured Thiocystis sp.]